MTYKLQRRAAVCGMCVTAVRQWCLLHSTNCAAECLSALFAVEYSMSMRRSLRITAAQKGTCLLRTPSSPGVRNNLHL